MLVIHNMECLTTIFRCQPLKLKVESFKNVEKTLVLERMVRKTITEGYTREGKI